METLYVNLWAGPGTGKSTQASLLHGALKAENINAELVSEYAKDLVWEDRYRALEFQPYVSIKQLWRMHRLRGKVEVVITDSPPLLGLVYTDPLTPVEVEEKFRAYLLAEFQQFWTLNVFLVRNPAIHPYRAEGRMQTEEEARQLDERICALLDSSNIPHYVVQIQPKYETAEWIANLVRREIRSG